VEVACLRRATDIQHRNLERNLDLLRSSFTRQHYVAMLRRFYGFHHAWEPQVAAQLDSELPDFFAPRRKLHNIEADLRYFGSEVEDVLRIPSCTTVPTLHSTGSALGSMYVIEGSTLGGRILTRHFGEHLGLLPDAGCRYFSGYEGRTAQMWSAFGELITSRPEAENDDMLDAAVATFDSLGQWLDKDEHVLTIPREQK
jgi:heme oxygenase (biliverdin-IX-beta and delta-forming)